MTEVLQNEPTKNSPISHGYARNVVRGFMRLYWPTLVAREDRLKDEADFEFSVEDLEKLVRYAAYHFRGNGSPDEAHQVVRGWSKLTYRKEKYTPSEEVIEGIKKRGAQS